MDKLKDDDDKNIKNIKGLRDLLQRLTCYISILI